MAATTKLTLLGSSVTSLDGRPSQRPIKSSLRYQYSSIAKRIRLWAKHFPEVRVIVRCGGDDDSNYYWGNGGGGGSGGDGEAEEERFQELPMLGWPWSSKDQEVEGWLGWQEMMVQLYGSEFDDEFLADDIFSIKNAAEYQKHEEIVLKDLEIAEDEMRFKANSMMKPVQIREKQPGDTHGEEF